MKQDITSSHDTCVLCGSRGGNGHLQVKPELDAADRELGGSSIAPAMQD